MKRHVFPSQVRAWRPSGVSGILMMNVAVAVTGFFKDVFLTAYLGTSQTADAFAIAYFIIDTVGNTIFAAGLGLASVPVLSSALGQRQGDGMGSRIRSLLWWSVGLGGVLVVLLWTTGPWILSFMATNRLLSEVSLLYLCLLPTVLLYPLVSVAASILQVAGRYVVSVSAALWLNGILLVGIPLLWQARVSLQAGGRWIAIFIVVGVVVQAVVLWLCWLTRKQSFAGEGMSRDGTGVTQSGGLWRYFSWYTVYLIASQCVGFVERALAARQGVGSVAGLTYAYRITQLPLWVFVSAIATFVFPAMAKAHSLGHTAKVQALFRHSMKSILIVTLPTMIFLFTYRDLLLTLLFQRGNFTMQSTRITANLLSGYVWTIPGQAFTVIALRYAVASGRIIAPVSLTILSVIINIVLDFELTSAIGVLGLGVGAAIAVTLNAGLLFFLLKRPLGLRILQHGGSLTRILVTNLFIWLVMSWIQSTLGDKWLKWNRLQNTEWVGFLVLFLGVIYWGGLTGWKVVTRIKRGG